MAESIKEELMRPYSLPAQFKVPTTKITVVGAGQVGAACAFSIMQQGHCRELALIDVLGDRVEGEMMDFQHGLQFVKNITIRASSDYAVSKGSDLVIVTAGERHREGESRRDLLHRNVDTFKCIIPKIVENSPNAILLIVSNPVDILTYVAWKISGFPRHRVLGSGTNLDTARFHFLISQKLDIAPSNVHGWIIGEHGDASVAAWSGVNVAGVSLKKLKPKLGTPEDPEDWEQVHRDVVNSACEVIKRKGYTSWAVGLSVATLAQAILRNERSIQAVSVNLKGFYGVEEDVFLSLPCVIGNQGVCDVIKQDLSEDETEKLQKCARVFVEIQNTLNILKEKTSGTPKSRM